MDKITLSYVKDLYSKYGREINMEEIDEALEVFTGYEYFRCFVIEDIVSDDGTISHNVYFRVYYYNKGIGNSIVDSEFIEHGELIKHGVVHLSLHLSELKDVLDDDLDMYNLVENNVSFMKICEDGKLIGFEVAELLVDFCNIDEVKEFIDDRSNKSFNNYFSIEILGDNYFIVNFVSDNKESGDSKKIAITKYPVSWYYLKSTERFLSNRYGLCVVTSR